MEPTNISNSSNFIAGNTIYSGRDTNIKIIEKIYIDSKNYQDLQIKKETILEELALIPLDNTAWRGKKQKELEVVEKEIIELKETVTRLHETFTRIKIDTERLRIAKALFDDGKFKEADAALNAVEMKEELDYLLAREAFVDKEKQEIQKHREQKANEYLIKAQTTYIAFDNPNRFADACHYYDEALRSWESYDTIDTYARFLYGNNHFTKGIELYEKLLAHYGEQVGEAEKARLLNNIGVFYINNHRMAEALAAYEEALEIRRTLAHNHPQAYLPDVAMTLNNIGVLHADNHRMAEALAAYEEALKIRRSLAHTHPQAYLPDVAMTLNNIGNLHVNNHRMAEALAAYEEAEKIYRDLAHTHPEAYLPAVAMTLNNIGALHADNHPMAESLAAYEGAENIYRTLAQTHPQAYLPDVAMTLNNIGLLHADNHRMAEALAAYEEALEIRRSLAKTHPEAFLPNVANTLVNLSIFYQDSQPDKEKSLGLVTEAVFILLPMVEKIPFTQRYMQSAKAVLRDWGMDPEEYISALL